MIRYRKSIYHECVIDEETKLSFKLFKDKIKRLLGFKAYRTISVDDLYRPWTRKVYIFGLLIYNQTRYVKYTGPKWKIPEHKIEMTLEEDYKGELKQL